MLIDSKLNSKKRQYYQSGERTSFHTLEIGYDVPEVRAIILATI